MQAQIPGNQPIDQLQIPGAMAAPAYLDAEGNRLKRKDLSKEAKQLLNDYRLVQYDMSKGKGYLNDDGFFAVK